MLSVALAMNPRSRSSTPTREQWPNERQVEDLEEMFSDDMDVIMALEHCPGLPKPLQDQVYALFGLMTCAHERINDMSRKKKAIESIMDVLKDVHGEIHDLAEDIRVDLEPHRSPDSRILTVDTIRQNMSRGEYLLFIFIRVYLM